MKSYSYHKLSILLFCMLLAWDIHADSIGNGVATEYCQGTLFNPTCQADEVILMRSALYGTLRLGTCVEEDPFDQEGCSVEVLGVADRQCSGRRECQVFVPNADMDKLRECKHDLSRYLEAAYWCTKVYKPRPTTCKSSTKISAGSKPAYLSSLISKETNCGITDYPWILEAEKGQQINLTLMYFNWHDHVEGASPCSTKLGYLFDLDSEDIVNICGSQSRVSHLHTTEGNQVQLLLDRATLVDSYFIIKYEATGCPMKALPENTWSEVSGDTMTVGCTTSDVTWGLKCRGSHWIGIMQSCEEREELVIAETTPATPNSKPVRSHDTSPGDAKYYLTVIVAVGSVTLITCVIVIVAGVVCIHRMNREMKNQASSDQTSCYLPMQKSNNPSNPFNTIPAQPGPTRGGPGDWPNGTLLSNNSGGTESAQYFVLDKDYMDNMYTLQARQ